MTSAGKADADTAAVNDAAAAEVRDAKAEAARALAPDGWLRAAINLANPVLFRADPSTGAPGGVAVDLASELARRLDVEVEWVPLPSARECVQAVQERDAAVGFFAIDPSRGGTLHFTPPYVLMEGVYVVRADSAMTRNEDVDRPGHRIAVGAGSAYALHLARELKHARVVDAPGSGMAVEVFLRDGLEAAAGVRQQMRADVQRQPGLRMLDGRFMAIHQSMATARDRGENVLAYLNDYIEDVKREGLVAAALQRYKVQGAAVAPAGYPRD